jgi:two-component system, cell cycle sensor histidine kinase and response regulator CckA
MTRPGNNSDIGQSIEDRLALIESRFAESQEAAHIGSWEWTLADSSQWWSDEFYRICGRERQSYPPAFQTFLRLLHSDDVEMVSTLFRRAREDHQPFELDHRIIRPNGEVRTLHARCRVILDASGQVVRMVGTAQDITEQKHVEEGLRRSQHRLQTMIDAEPACVKLVSADGVLLDMNRAGVDMLGADDLSQLVGRPIVQLVHPADRDRFLAMHHAASAGTPSRSEFRVITFRGEERWMDARAVPFDAGLAKSPITTVLSCTSDVTERKHLEGQLRQSQRLEAVGRLAGGIAHDFNNLLTAILGYCDLAIGHLPPDSGARSDLAEIRDAGNRAADLTQQLLAFSRKQTLRPRVIDLNEAVRGILKMLPRLIRENITIATDLAPDLLHVNVDATQLDQVLLNLAINARDAMPAGGALRMATANRMLTNAPIPEPCEFEPGDYVALTVTDSGAGMDADTRARIFEPFFTTKQTGTGLGLSTVYGIVKQSRGFIVVDSQQGAGTTFTIYLPATTQPVQDVMPSGVPSATVGTETILIVEDASAVRTLTRRMLEGMGYAVHEASNGEEALAVSANAGTLDLLLTDVVMPGMSGIHVASHLKQSRPMMRVLYMSGYDDDLRARHIAAERPSVLLRKPFTADQLALAVREALEEPAESSRSPR